MDYKDIVIIILSSIISVLIHQLANRSGYVMDYKDIVIIILSSIIGVLISKEVNV